MNELVTASAKLISGLIMFVSGWLMYQLSKFEPIISQGIDQLLSLAFLVTGIVVLWRAFKQKDEELQDFKREIREEQNNIMKELINKLNDE